MKAMIPMATATVKYSCAGPVSGDAQAVRLDVERDRWATDTDDGGLGEEQERAAALTYRERAIRWRPKREDEGDADHKQELEENRCGHIPRRRGRSPPRGKAARRIVRENWKPMEGGRRRSRRRAPMRQKLCWIRLNDGRVVGIAGLRCSSAHPPASRKMSDNRPKELDAFPSEDVGDRVAETPSAEAKRGRTMASGAAAGRRSRWG